MSSSSSKSGSRAEALREDALQFPQPGDRLLFKDLYDVPDPRPTREVLDLVRQCLSILEDKALAPANMISSAREGSLGGVWMYFWDGNNYADLEFSNDGRVTLCFNLEHGTADVESDDIVDRWQTKGPRRIVEGYAVEPDKRGLRSAVKEILKHVKRTSGKPTQENS